MCDEQAHSCCKRGTECADYCDPDDLDDLDADYKLASCSRRAYNHCGVVDGGLFGSVCVAILLHPGFHFFLYHGAPDHLVAREHSDKEHCSCGHQLAKFVCCAFILPCPGREKARGTQPNQSRATYYSYDVVHGTSAPTLLVITTAKLNRSSALSHTGFLLFRSHSFTPTHRLLLYRP